jgi:hypothetical protein
VPQTYYTKLRVWKDSDILTEMKGNTPQLLRDEWGREIAQLGPWLQPVHLGFQMIYHSAHNDATEYRVNLKPPVYVSSQSLQSKHS